MCEWLVVLLLPGFACIYSVRLFVLHVILMKIV